MNDLPKGGNTRVGAPRSRRKEARPQEIVEAALACFLEGGFERTKLDEVARRAGVAKGTLYLYFETKEQLFRAVVQHVTQSNVRHLQSAIADFEGPFEELAALVLHGAARSISASRVPAVARLILREADRIPDLARIWFEEVAAPMLSAGQAVIEKAQAKGEVRPGDARAHMLSLVAPMLVAFMFREVVGPLGVESINLDRLAEEHEQTLLRGLLVKK